MIYIVRHGQTELNSRMQLQGRSNHPLNEAGLSQANDVRERLREVRFSAVYSSPLQRAVQTAGIIAPDAEIVTDDRLIEMDYGPYEGMDLRNPDPEVLAFFRDFVHVRAPRGMEALESVVRRTGEFLNARCRTAENILISTHAIAMKGILEYLTPDSRGSYWSKNIGNCVVYVTDYEDGRFSVPKELD